jgi:hypothetical protein
MAIEFTNLPRVFPEQVNISLKNKKRQYHEALQKHIGTP